MNREITGLETSCLKDHLSKRPVVCVNQIKWLKCEYYILPEDGAKFDQAKSLCFSQKKKSMCIYISNMSFFNCFTQDNFQRTNNNSSKFCANRKRKVCRVISFRYTHHFAFRFGVFVAQLGVESPAILAKIGAHKKEDDGVVSGGGFAGHTRNHAKYWNDKIRIITW